MYCYGLVVIFRKWIKLDAPFIVFRGRKKLVLLLVMESLESEDCRYHAWRHQQARKAEASLVHVFANLTDKDLRLLPNLVKATMTRFPVVSAIEIPRFSRCWEPCHEDPALSWVVSHLLIHFKWNRPLALDNTADWKSVHLVRTGSLCCVYQGLIYLYVVVHLLYYMMSWHRTVWSWSPNQRNQGKI